MTMINSPAEEMNEAGVDEDGKGGFGEGEIEVEDVGFEPIGPDSGFRTDGKLGYSEEIRS